MSGLEALAAISVVSNIVQLVHAGIIVYDRLNEFQSVTQSFPEALVDLQVELPLLLRSLEGTKQRAESGSIDVDTQEDVLRVVKGCKQLIDELQGLLDRWLPKPSDHLFKKIKKLVLSFEKEKEIDSIKLRLKGYIQTLTYYESGDKQSTMVERIRPLFEVPFSKDEHFIGRQEELNKIDALLSEEGRVAVVGIGGVGKSQVAIEYCHRYRAKHPNHHVLWVHGSNDQRFRQAYHNIARRLSLPNWDSINVDYLQLVLEWMNDDTKPEWLLVLDNADDVGLFFTQNATNPSETPQIPLQKYLPHVKAGRLLVTSRDQRAGTRLAGKSRSITLTEPTTKQCIEVLRSRIPDDQEHQIDAMEELVGELSFLPLAITQAAAFITETDISIPAYTQMLKNEDDDMLRLLEQDLGDERRDVEDAGSSNSIIRTWKLSFDRISAEQPKAADLLALMSMLDRQAVPERLLRDKESLADHTTVITMLQAYSLIKRQRKVTKIRDPGLLALLLHDIETPTLTGQVRDLCEGDTFGMHRLVQICVRRWLEHQNSSTHWQMQALEILSKHYPSGADLTLGACEILMPHVSIVLKYIHPGSDLAKEVDFKYARTRLVEKTALFEYNKGMYESANDKIAYAIDFQRWLVAKCTIEENVYSIAYRYFRNTGLKAAILQEQGLLEQSLELHKEVCEYRVEFLGVDHEDTIKSKINLASIHVKMGQLQEAERLGLEVCDTRQRLLGESNRLTLFAMRALACTYKSQERWDEAIFLERNIATITQKTYGYNDGATAKTHANLAWTLAERQHYAESIQIYSDVVETCKRIYGVDQRTTHNCMGNLAVIYAMQAHWGKAEELQQQVVFHKSRLLGSQHPDTIMDIDVLNQFVTAAKEGSTERWLRPWKPSNYYEH